MDKALKVPLLITGIGLTIGAGILAAIELIKHNHNDDGGTSDSSGSGGGSNTKAQAWTPSAAQVKDIQNFLNTKIEPPAQPLTVDGQMGPITIAVWKAQGYAYPVLQADYYIITSWAI